MRENKSNKPVKKIDKRYFTFFGGIAFCLFAVALILNVGGPAKVFAFPFTFMFGLASYVIYIFIYAYGLFLFFRERRMKIRFNNYLIGGFIIFISVLIIATLIVIGTNKEPVNIGLKDVIDENGNQTSYNFSTYYMNKVFNAIADSNGHSGYWNVKIVNLFKDNKFGGGYAGYALVGVLTAGLKTTGAWVIGIQSIFSFVGSLIIQIDSVLHFDSF